MTTSYVNTIDAKEEFSELINRVSHNKERIILTRRGKEIAAIVPLEDFLQLEQKQNKNDLEAAVDALQEARSRGTITLDEFKDEIG
jgi:prevent-host-death family protein